LVLASGGSYCLSNMYGSACTEDLYNGGPWYATTPAWSVGGCSGAPSLTFQRWLSMDGYEYYGYDQYTGGAWVNMWNNGNTVSGNQGSQTHDTVWASVTVPLATTATQFRWSWAMLDADPAYPGSGWNVDNVQITCPSSTRVWTWTFTITIPIPSVFVKLSSNSVTITSATLDGVSTSLTYQTLANGDYVGGFFNSPLAAGTHVITGVTTATTSYSSYMGVTNSNNTGSYVPSIAVTAP